MDQVFVSHLSVTLEANQANAACFHLIRENNTDPQTADV